MLYTSSSFDVYCFLLNELLFFFFLMIRRPPRSTRTDTLFPYTTLFRSQGSRRWGRARSVSILPPCSTLQVSTSAMTCKEPFSKNSVSRCKGLASGRFRYRHGGVTSKAAPISCKRSYGFTASIRCPQYPCLPHPASRGPRRPDERRVGKAWGSTCRPR